MIQLFLKNEIRSTIPKLFIVMLMFTAAEWGTVDDEWCLTFISTELLVAAVTPARYGFSIGIFG
jgi:hypothetical protein